jgi:hypothetical protein
MINRFSTQKLRFFVVFLQHLVANWDSIPKLFVGVIINQFALDHSKQIAHVIVHDKSHRAMTPAVACLEFSKPLTVLFRRCIKYHPGATDK